MADKVLEALFSVPSVIDAWHTMHFEQKDEVRYLAHLNKHCILFSTIISLGNELTWSPRLRAKLSLAFCSFNKKDCGLLQKISSGANKLSTTIVDAIAKGKKTLSFKCWAWWRIMSPPNWVGYVLKYCMS